MKSNEYRKQVADHIALLARASEQAEYERRVPIACVPEELVCIFCDDLFHPKSPDFLAAFTEDEIKDLAKLYGLLCSAAEVNAKSVNEALKSAEWRKAVSFAKTLDGIYGGVA